MRDNWDQQYRDGRACRYWPNEELVRFLARTYHDAEQRIAIELGCGAGGNMLAVCRAGFLTYGYDVAETALTIAWDTMAGWAQAACRLGVLALPDPVPHDAATVDLVVDCLTVQHLTRQEHEAVYADVARVLKPGGRFFTVHWMGGDAECIFPAHPELVHSASLAIGAMLDTAGLTIEYDEMIDRTYQRGVLLGMWRVVAAVRR